MTPRVVLTWHPKSDATVYASYAQGFRSGLQQDPFVARNVGGGLPPTTPDTLTNYELGTKQNLLHGRLYLDAAVYYMDWKDVQQPIGVPTSNNIFTALLNGGSADGFGSEIGITLKPREGLLLNGNFSWNDLTFDEVLLNSPFAVGSRPENSPEFLASGSIDYSFPLGGVTGHVGTSGYYVSGDTVTAFSGVTTKTPSRFVARVEAGIEVTSGWAAKAYVDNVTDTYRGANGFASLGFSDWTTRPRPRTYGLQVEFGFR